MSTKTPILASATEARRFANAAEWLHALGDVPLERIVFDPPPGTASEADVLSLVESKLNRRRCELIDATLVEKAMGWDEGGIAFAIGLELLQWARARRAGRVIGADGPARMKRRNVRMPDVAFYSAQRLKTLPSQRMAIASIAPDLAVEVLSRSNTAKEMQLKRVDYFESGTRLVWEVDADARTVAVYRDASSEPVVLSQTETLVAEDVLPGFAMKVADIFQDMDA